MALRRAGRWLGKPLDGGTGRERSLKSKPVQCSTLHWRRKRGTKAIKKEMKEKGEATGVRGKEKLHGTTQIKYIIKLRSMQNMHKSLGRPSCHALSWPCSKGLRDVEETSL